jgi:hypothetical protein
MDEFENVSREDLIKLIVELRASLHEQFGLVRIRQTEFDEAIAERDALLQVETPGNSESQP